MTVLDFDKDNKDFFSNFDKDKGRESEDDFFNFGDEEDEYEDSKSREDNLFDFDDEEDEWENDLDGTGIQEEKSGFEGFNFDDDGGERHQNTSQPKREDLGRKESGNKKGNGVLGVLTGGLDKVLGYVGLTEGSMLHKLIKYGIYLAVILFIVFFVIGYLIIGTLMGGNKEDEVVENTPTVQEDKTFFEGVNDKIFGVFTGDSEEEEPEGINEVEIDSSYEEDYLELARTNVFRYKQPSVISGKTFKIFNVEPYDDLTGENSDKSYIKVDFGIKNESTEDLKFTEYDFKLYTKEALESKDAEDKGYIGIDEENKSINVNVEDLSESVKGLFVSKGIEPTIIRMGDKSTSVGRGVVKPNEVYSAFVVFEVVPGEENEYILGFNPSKYPFEMLMKTYE